MRQQPRRQTKPRRSESSRQGISWKYSALTLVCGAILVTGFFFAGKLHFSSMDYGIRNSRLRKQLDEMEAEKRRLLLSREISLSPAELMRAAKKIGFSQSSGAPEIAKAAPTAEAIKAMQPPSVPVVQKTVSSKPIEPAKTASAAKPAKVEKQAKQESDGPNKKVKS